MTASSIGVLLSDWHLGELEEDYNIAIAQERIEAIPEMLHVDRGIREIWMLFNGDLSQGAFNFKTQIAQSETHTRGQHDVCARLISWLLRATHKRFSKPRIRVVFNPGNHGKIGKHEHPDSNADLEVGDRVRDGMRGERWCDVSSTGGISRVVEIAGLRVAMIHKAEAALQVDPSMATVIRPGESMRPGGILRTTPVALRRIRNRLAYYNAGLLLTAHFHSPSEWWVPEIGGQRLLHVQNGALTPGNRYSEQMGLFSESAQAVIRFGGGRAECVQWLRW